MAFAIAKRAELKIEMRGMAKGSDGDGDGEGRGRGVFDQVEVLGG